MEQTILILDSQPLMAESIHNVLNFFLKNVSLNLCCQLSKVSNTIAACKPTLIILDNALGKPAELRLFEKVKAQSTSTKILIFGHEEDYSTVKNYLKNGANGYLLRTTSSSELLKAIEVIERGETFLDNKLKQTLFSQLFLKTEKKKQPLKITKRETEILQMVVDEYTTKEIGKLLFITPETVETHRNHLIQKFGVRNTAGLVRETLLRGTLTGFISTGKP